MSNHTYERECGYCHKVFETTNRAQTYCDHICRDRNQKKKRMSEPGHWLNFDKPCSNCGKPFRIPADSSPARKYCSDECVLEARQKSTNRFKNMNPQSMREYNRRRQEKYGTDNLTTRLLRKYPDLPRSCESAGCTEGRVLEIAHKPEHRRHGACRVMKFYERHMFWILCPTCHKLIDRGVCTPEELGLKE